MVQSGIKDGVYIRLSASLRVMLQDFFDWLYPAQKVIGTNAHMARVLAHTGNYPRPRLTCPK